MPDSDIDKQQKKKDLDASEFSSAPTVLLVLRKPLIILAHITAFAASLMFAFLVANNMQFRQTWLVEQYPLLLLFIIIIKLVIFGFFKQYRGWWRYVGISDLLGILRASLVSTLLIVILWVTLLNAPIRQKLQNITEVSQAVFMVDLFATFLLLAGLRMIIRQYYE